MLFLKGNHAVRLQCLLLRASRKNVEDGAQNGGEKLWSWNKDGKEERGGGGENAEEDKEGRKEVDRRTGNTKREQTTLKETRWAEACV